MPWNWVLLSQARECCWIKMICLNYLMSIYCIGQDPCEEYRCRAAGLSPTKVPFKYVRAFPVQGDMHQAPGGSNEFSSLKVLISLLFQQVY